MASGQVSGESAARSFPPRAQESTSAGRVVKQMKVLLGERLASSSRAVLL